MSDRKTISNKAAKRRRGGTNQEFAGVVAPKSESTQLTELHLHQERTGTVPPSTPKRKVFDPFGRWSKADGRNIE